MPSLSPQDVARITNYVASELESGDLARTAQWIAEDGERTRLAEALKRSQDILRKEWAVREDVDERVSALMAEVARRDMGARRKRETFARQTWRGDGGSLGTRVLRRWVWPAGAALIAGMALLMVRPHYTSYQSAPKVYRTPVKRSAVITLADGTVVMLGPQSQLSIVEMNSLTRTVAVDGEAYFTVTRSSSAPFLVRSGNVTTRVLGTDFLVRHAEDNARVIVSVADGKVYVVSRIHPEKGITLSAGQIGDLTDSTTHVSTVDDMTPGTEWVHGQLGFHDTPVAMVLKTLSRWYGYQFYCADSTLLNRSVTIAVSARSSAEALVALEQVLSVNLTVAGDTVTLIPQPLQPAKGTSRIRSYDVWTPMREVGR